MAEESKAVAKTGGRGLAEILQAKSEDIAQVCSTVTSADRLIKIALQAYTRTPALQACSPESIYVALLHCAELGLEPGPLGHAYLVPFGKDCTFIAGYKGLIALALRSGTISTIAADVVAEGDEWNYEVDTGVPKLFHRPLLGREKEPKFKAAYAVATLKDGRMQARVVEPWEIEKVRQASRAKDGDLWTKWTKEAWIKTAIRKASKQWPASTELQRAMEIEDEQEGFRDPVKRGNWSRPAAVGGHVPLALPDAARNVEPDPEVQELALEYISQLVKAKNETQLEAILKEVGTTYGDEHDIWQCLEKPIAQARERVTPRSA